MKDKNNNANKPIKIDFKGKFGIDGCFGGDIEPYWEITEDTYIKIKGKEMLKSADKTDSGKYKLYLIDLIKYSDEGKKQSVSLKIITE